MTKSKPVTFARPYVAEEYEPGEVVVVNHTGLPLRVDFDMEAGTEKLANPVRIHLRGPARSTASWELADSKWGYKSSQPCRR